MKRIQVLGTGCAKCNQLFSNVEEAVKLADMEASVEKVTDINEITSFGVMMTPALAVDGEVKAMGKVPTPEEIQKLL